MLDVYRSFVGRRALTALLAVAGWALLASCVAPPPSPLVPAMVPATLPGFDTSEVAWSMAPGSSTVQGMARVGANAVRTCAGAEAQLVPASPFATAMMRTVFGNTTKGYVTLASSPPYPRSIPPDFAQSIRRTACSPSGEFRFDRVPAGTYYVFANVVWRVGDEAAPRGGSLMRRIDVVDQVATSIVLEP